MGFKLFCLRCDWEVQWVGPYPKPTPLWELFARCPMCEGPTDAIALGLELPTQLTKQIAPNSKQSLDLSDDIPFWRQFWNPPQL